ncbi:phage holin family protein [Ruegeria sp. B32]|uniref:phage holin family protein n=1 Tax=Ruegeria sp. B32 TaxID=2867020 RepID=UPI0021A2D286|nr:phage holin family protein [Ruegeria sp. B32]UWR07632.1 phage holin family protein [Ruegeria sp. B32]
MHNPNDLRSAPGLLANALKHLSGLLHAEAKLAKEELSRNLTRAGVGLACIGIALILLMIALNLMATALVAYFAAKGLSAGMASLLVGAGLALAAACLALFGRSRMSATALVPEKAMKNLQRDIEAMKESTHV